MTSRVTVLTSMFLVGKVFALSACTSSSQKLLYTPSPSRCDPSGLCEMRSITDTSASSETEVKGERHERGRLFLTSGWVSELIPWIPVDSYRQLPTSITSLLLRHVRSPPSLITALLVPTPFTPWDSTGLDFHLAPPVERSYAWR